jgi:hypothetical protein
MRLLADNIQFVKYPDTHCNANDVFVGVKGISPSQGNGRFDRHAGRIGKAARSANLAKDGERPVNRDFNRDLGIFDEFLIPQSPTD